MAIAEWTPEELAIAECAVGEHRRKVAAEKYQAARLEYHAQIQPGDWIEFRDPDHRGITEGRVVARGSHAGWVDVRGVETRFDYMDTIQVTRDGEAL